MGKVNSGGKWDLSGQILKIKDLEMGDDPGLSK